MSIYSVPGTMLKVLCGRFALILTTTLRSKFYYYLHSRHKNRSLVIELVTGRTDITSNQNLPVNMTQQIYDIYHSSIMKTEHFMK